MAWNAAPVAVADHERVAQAAKSIVQGAESSTRLTTVITLSTTTTTVDPEAALPALARRRVTLVITIAVLVVTEAVAEAEAEAVREVEERRVNVVMSAIIADVGDRARQVARLVRVVTRA
jgi:hypothetical protein